MKFVDVLMVKYLFKSWGLCEGLWWCILIFGMGVSNRVVRGVGDQLDSGVNFEVS